MRYLYFHLLNAPILDTTINSRASSTLESNAEPAATVRHLRRWKARAGVCTRLNAVPRLGTNPRALPSHSHQVHLPGFDVSAQQQTQRLPPGS